MANLNLKDISNSNILKTDKIPVFNNQEMKAATIENIVHSVPGLMATGTCATAANVANKAVTSSDWIAKPGLSIMIEFENANSADNVTLTINSGTAIPVYYINSNGVRVSGAVIPAGAVIFTLNAASNKFYAHLTRTVSAIDTSSNAPVDSTAVNTAVSGEATARDTAIAAAVNALDVASAGGSGKFIQAISETNGKITAVEGTIDSAVTSGSGNPVSGDAVNTEIIKKADKTDLAVPSDAIVHYSFDDLPDMPDGTANVKLTDGNTYNIQSTNYKFFTETSATITNNNGNVQIQVLTASSNQGVYLSNNYTKNKCIKIRLNVTSLGNEGKIEIRNTLNTLLKEITELGIYEIVLFHSNDSTSGVYIRSNFTFTTIVEEIYIGDGSYVTPVIDNSGNGNNATNNGVIAVSGVSGKGGYFLNGKNAEITDFNFPVNFSVSLWIKVDNNTTALYEDIISKAGQFILRNGTSWGNYLMVYLYAYDGSTLLANAKVSNLLEPNVWTHICFVRNGTSAFAYINGVQVKKFTLANETISINSNVVKVSGQVNTRPHTLDDINIFDRALSQEEVTALYLNKANTPKFYNINNYKLEKADDFPVQNSKELISSGGVYAAGEYKQDKNLATAVTISGTQYTTVESAIQALSSAINQ